MVDKEKLKRILSPILHFHKGNYNKWRNRGSKEQLGLVEAIVELEKLMKELHLLK